MLCFACAGMLCFVRFVRAGERGERAWPWGLAYAVMTAAAAYCGFIVVLIVIPQALALLGRPRRVLAGFVAAAVGLIVLCVPIAVLAVRRGSGQLFWVPRPAHQVETQVMQSLASSGLESTFHRVASTTPGWIITAAVLLGLIGWCVRAAPGDRLGGFGMRLALLWALVPGEAAAMNWSAHFSPQRRDVAAAVFGEAFELLSDGAAALRLDAPALARRDAASLRLAVRRRGRLAGFRS